jgi:hypothetical protein
MRITAKDNVDQFIDQLDANLIKRLPIAIAIALTKTAKLVQAEERAEMERVFDRPTPYTLGSVMVAPATKDTLEASVWLKDDDKGGGSHPATEYLVPHIDGGARVEKRSEFILRNAGILPTGMIAIPGQAARLDAYGNISRGQVQQILSGLRVSESVAGHTSDRPREKSRQRKGLAQFFVASRYGRGRHLHPGVWERAGATVRPILMFVRGARYTKRLDFHGVADRVADVELPNLLRIEIDKTVQRVRG